MIDKFGGPRGRTRLDAEKVGQLPQRILLGFIGVAVCAGLGVGVGVMVTDKGDEALISPSALIGTEAAQTATQDMRHTARRGLRYQPDTATETVVATAAPEPSANVSSDVADLVTRSVGTLINAPLEVPTLPQANSTAATLQQIVAPVSETPRIDPETLFSNASGASNSGCVEDLNNLVSDTRVYFPSGGLTPDDDGMARARLIGLIGQGCPGVVIQVQGHSDPSGDPAVNLRLSQQRAQMVIDRISASGVNTGMLQAVGMGDRQPSGVVGPEPDGHYDRRVEFALVMTAGGPAPRVAGLAAAATQPACVTELQTLSSQTRVQFSPNAVTAGESQLLPVYQLANAMASCPGTRLRITGQFSDAEGSAESPSTARLRAIAMMTTLVATGVSSDQMFVIAPSTPTALSGVSDHRIDFEVVYDDA